MLALSFRHAFPGIALDIAFEAPTPGITVLFGPSGAGKSTVAAVLAGLLRPREMRLAVDGVVLADATRFVPAERRRIGMVFQDSRLFPHLDVAGNLRYGLRRVRGERPIGFEAVVGLLGIGALLGRWPGTLSGGERQRVAIGRALLAQPRLLVMDEPLASLDDARRAEIMPYLLRLKAELGLPIVYVTHARQEMARLADTLVLLERGRCLAAGPLRQIASRSDLALGRDEAAAAVLAARVEGHDAQRRLTSLRAGDVALWVPLRAEAVGAAVRLRLPAREVILAGDAPRAISVNNVLAGTIRAIAGDAAGHVAIVEVAIGRDEAGEIALLARLTPDAVGRLGLAVGGRVFALVKSVAIEILA